MEQKREFDGRMPIYFLSEEAFFRDFSSRCHMDELCGGMSVSKCCKAEVYRDAIEGTIRVPPHKLDEGGTSFGFFLDKDRLYIIEEQPVIQGMWDAVKEKRDGPLSAAMCLLELLEALSKDDIPYVQYLEQEMGCLEDMLMRDREQTFSQDFLHFRRKLSGLHYYYEQMIDIGETLQAEYARREQEEMSMEWSQYSCRMERLHEYVSFLREYIIQLRDLFHTQMHDRQNRGINFLTVVTSLFLPLTLLTGWYGMNFKYMPEVDWEYGYVMVIGIALLIICAEVFYIIKKRLLL